MALGLDVDVAISSAHNVVDNNCFLIVIPLITLGLCIADRYFDPVKKKGEELLKSVEKHISDYVKDAKLTPQEKRTLAQAVVNYLDEFGGQYNGGQGAQSLAKAASDYVKTVLDGIEAYREMGGANGYALGDKLIGNDRVAAYLSHAGAMGGMVFGLKTALPGKGVPGKGGGKSSAKGAVKSSTLANDNKPQSPKNPRIGMRGRDYIRDMEDRSGLPISQDQRGHLTDALRNNNYSKLEGDAAKKHKAPFRQLKFKESLISDWERNTEQQWPRYKETVFNKHGEITANQGQRLQVHHIIPQNRGGPHEWWNIHPLEIKDHQQGVHLGSSFLSKILKE